MNKSIQISLFIQRLHASGVRCIYHSNNDCGIRDLTFPSRFENILNKTPYLRKQKIYQAPIGED